MTIRTKVRLIALLPLLVGLIIVSILLITTQRLQRAEEIKDFSYTLMKGLLELNVVTQDYLQHPSERPQTQWYTKHQSLQMLLANMTPISPATRESIAYIDREHRTLIRLFGRLRQEQIAPDTTSEIAGTTQAAGCASAMALARPVKIEATAVLPADAGPEPAAEY